MRRLALVLLVALSSCKDKPVGASADPASAAAPEAITIVVLPPTAGQKVRTARKNHMTMKVAIDIGLARNKADIDDRDSSVEALEALAVEARTVTRAKVTFVEKTRVQSENGTEKSTPAPVVGKTYVLALVGGKPAVTDEGGKPVPAAEEELVLRTHRAFGKPRPSLDAFPKGPLRVGDEVPSLKGAMQEQLSDAEEGADHPEFVVDSVKLASIEKGADPVAVFKIALTARTPDGSKEPFAMSARLEGTLKVRARDGAELGLDVRGPLKLEGRDPKLKVEGKGEMHLESSCTYGAGPS